MKAVVMYPMASMPQYAEVAEPIAQQVDEILVKMKAVSIKNLDKSRAGGRHYSSEENIYGKIIGIDGVGVLENGQRVYGVGTEGTLAEKALFRAEYIVSIPDGLDNATASALPNAVMGSAMALLFRAGMQPGETVLINGATGFTGRMAVQLAKHYRAGKIIVTGRNEESLQSLSALGADKTIALHQSDEELIKQLKAIHATTPINVIIDYLWGHSAELIFAALKGKGIFSPRSRFVTVGAMSGDTIQLSAEILRSVDLQLSGSGLGSWTKEDMRKLILEILPEAFRLAAEGQLKTDIATVRFEDIKTFWEQELIGGKRLVAIL